MSSDKTGLNYDQTAPLGGSGGFSYPQPGAQTGGIDQGYGAPPPAYDTTQPAGYGFSGQPQPTVTTTQPQQQVVYHVEVRYGTEPMRINCPSCHSDVKTTVKSEPGVGAWIAGITLCIFGCICGCCLIPCCVDGMKVFTHTCPNCKVMLGKYKGAASLA